jgi:RNA polymerase sigma factor (sigma-70 family)
MAQMLSDSSSDGGGRFDSTVSSMLIAASDPASPKQQQALARFYLSYWKPFYVFVRKKGRPREEARDLTQGFFVHLLERQILAKVTREGGKFRSFLLTVLNHYLENERARQMAQKRGGGMPDIPIEEVESHCQKELADQSTPEALFDRKWAQAVLEQVLLRLRTEYARAGKAKLFDCLQGCLPGAPKKLSYEEASQALGMKIEAVRMAAHRLRRRYGELLRQEIATPGMKPEAIDEELHCLLTILGGL